MKPIKKSIPIKRTLFAVRGKIEYFGGKKVFVPFSKGHLDAELSGLNAGQKVTITFTESRYMRSADQRRYHMVLMGYIGRHCGASKDEMHDAVMRAVFGEKTIKAGSITLTARKSMKDDGNLTKYEAVELIDYDLNLCAELEIRVPTREELGYLPG